MALVWRPISPSASESRLPYALCVPLLSLDSQPIKSSDGRVTHYVGIQQDVTLLSEMSSHPHRWTPPEVSLFLLLFIV